MVKFGLVIFGSVRLVIEQEILIFLIFLNMPKNGLLMLTDQKEFQILNLHHKKNISKIKVPVFLMPIARLK